MFLLIVQGSSSLFRLCWKYSSASLFTRSKGQVKALPHLGCLKMLMAPVALHSSLCTLKVQINIRVPLHQVPGGAKAKYPLTLLRFATAYVCSVQSFCVGNIQHPRTVLNTQLSGETVKSRNCTNAVHWRTSELKYLLIFMFWYGLLKSMNVLES